MLRLKYEPLLEVRRDKCSIFIDNEYLCTLKAGETREFRIEKGPHFISGSKAAKWNIFHYEYRFQVDNDVDNDEEDINIEAGSLNSVNLLFIFGTPIFFMVFPDMRPLIKCLILVFINFLLRFVFKRFVFGKYTIWK
jgi:hypothetical protein